MVKPPSVTIENFDVIEFPDNVSHIDNQYVNENENLFILCRERTIENDVTNGIIVFGVKSLLQQCMQSNEIFIDATFSISPLPFSQVLIIGYLLGIGNYQKLFPGLFVLMTNKSEVVYDKIFNFLNDYANNNEININWTSIMTDNEMALRNAIRSFLIGRNILNCHLNSCLFHTSQCFIRKIRYETLINIYEDIHYNFNAYVKQILAIGLVPEDRANEAFNVVRAQLHNPVVLEMENAGKVDNFNRFYDYLNTNYIGVNGVKLHEWNVNAAEHNRTNNHLEGMNNKLNLMLEKYSSTNFYKFTSGLKVFYSEYLLLLYQLNVHHNIYGEVFPPKDYKQQQKEMLIDVAKLQLQRGEIALIDYVGKISKLI